MWSFRSHGEQGSAFVECSFDAGALAVAGLVAAGDEDPPFFGFGGARRNAGADGGLPMIEWENVDSMTTSSSSGCMEGFGCWWFADVRGELIVPVIELCFSLIHGTFRVTCCCEHRQRQQEGACGETHLVGCWYHPNVGEEIARSLRSKGGLVKKRPSADHKLIETRSRRY